MSQPRELSMSDAARQIEQRQLTCEELMNSVLEQIDRVNPILNSFITVRDHTELLEDARASDRRCREGTRRPLEGMPIALKDNYATAGIRTTAGSKILAEWIPDRDASCVEKLKNAGTIIVGKLNMHEFANGPTTDNPHYGRAANPWDISRTAGGSSGGSGAALAADMCLGATGSDTGGSVRCPAAFCGVVGLKPTYGLISREGIVPFSWSLDHAGPMARTVADTALLLQAMAGYDPVDPGSVNVTVPDYLQEIDRGIDGIVVGVETGYLTRVMEPGVRKAFEQALARMSDLGAKIEELELPSMEAVLSAELAILFPEAASVHRRNLDERVEDYGEDVRLSLLSGRLYRAVDYVEAQRARAVIKRELTQAFDRVHILAMPTMVIEAPEWGRESFALHGEEYDVLRTFVRCLAPFNLSGNPALSVPYAYGDTGLPVGLELVGPHWSETLLFRVAWSIEADFKPHRKAPDLEGILG